MLHCINNDVNIVNVLFEATNYIGPLVKWLRHRPFTAVTRVRIPYGSPKFNKLINTLSNNGGLAQLGEHLPYKQGVGGSSPSSSTKSVKLEG